MKRLVVGLLLCLFLPMQAAWFGYDRGIAAAHGGDSERATQLLTDALTANPENPELLYDSGVLASRQKNYAQAEAFFSKTVGHTPADSQLHRQALFNLGNAYVGTKKLHEALNIYNQLLALDPKHEKARHNRDVVKKMLEQQAQEPQTQEPPTQESSTQESQNKDDKKQNQENKNQQQNQQGGNKNGSEQQKSGKQQDSSSPDGSSCNQDHQKRDGKDSKQLDERDGYKERYGKRDNNADGQHKQQSGANKAEDVENKPEGKEGCNNQRTQQHDDSPSRARGVHKDDTTTQRMKVGGKAQESAQKGAKKQYAAWAESMLDEVQLKDEALNKVLVQKAVAGTMGGRDGECCW